ncbi:MAG: hypothetical protein V4736_10315 [Bdellovibrionota bacterium]
MDIETSESFEIKPISQLDRPKRSLKLEHVIVDMGLDFIEDQEISKEPVASRQVFTELRSWCAENNLSPSQVYTWTDQINIRVLGADRPLIFLPNGEVFLTAFVYFFICGAIVGAAFARYWTGFNGYLGLALGTLAAFSFIHAFLVLMHIRSARKKFFLPDWQAFSIRLKLRK